MFKKNKEKKNFKKYKLKIKFILNDFCLKGLISSGVELEVYPTNFTLPLESGPHPVKIMVVPKEPGVLSISGLTNTNIYYILLLFIDL